MNFHYLSWTLPSLSDKTETGMTLPAFMLDGQFAVTMTYSSIMDLLDRMAESQKYSKAKKKTDSAVSKLN